MVLLENAHDWRCSPLNLIRTAKPTLLTYRRTVLRGLASSSQLRLILFGSVRSDQLFKDWRIGDYAIPADKVTVSQNQNLKYLFLFF